MDKAMRIFSAVATLFMPLTLASGIWGMNVQVPWADVEGLGPFFGIIGFMSFINEDTLETTTGVTFFMFFYSLFLFGRNKIKNPESNA